MFQKRKARKLEAEHRQEAVTKLRGMAASLPASDGTVSIDDFRDFWTVVAENNIALRDFPDIRDPVLLGLAQGGYFLHCDTTLILKKDESALWNEPAALLKEVTDREFRGGSQGISVPIGGGARYRVGSMRGHMVTIGTHWTAADSGILTVTDKRIVYHGGRKTLEFLFAKLATLNVYTDAIDLGVTNRQSTSSFRVSDPALVAGMIHAALDRVDSDVTILNIKVVSADD